MDAYVAACEDLARAVEEGVYGGYDFISIPRPPTDAERAVNKWNRESYMAGFVFPPSRGWNRGCLCQIAFDFTRHSSALW